MKTIAFFNNKGGVGKTSLVYHLAWMMREKGTRVLAVDLDPQANLTSACLDDEHIESLWPDSGNHASVFGAIEPVLRKMGDIRAVPPVRIEDRLHLLAGDLRLSAFEGRLTGAWGACLDETEKEDGLRVVSAFYRCIHTAAHAVDATLALIDVGPNIGALNRGALVAADTVVVPLAADLFSVQALRNVGPTLNEWRRGWEQRRQSLPTSAPMPLPIGAMQPLGYVILNPSVRENRPVKAYRRWADRIPAEFATHVLSATSTVETPETDSNCLSLIKHFKSLMPMSLEKRKPMFLLKPADGAIGGHAGAVAACYEQFSLLADKLLGLVKTPG